MEPAPVRFRVRVARAEDIPDLERLIELSVRGLQAADYSNDQVDGALGTVLGLDTQLVADGTYFAVEAPGGTIAACGGWSKRKTLFGADRGPGREATLLDPAADAARIRALFVHPDWSRQGIGTILLGACESAARAEGFQRYELAATLTGVRLFSRRGYVEIGRIDVPLGNGLSLPVVRMTKPADG